MAVHRLIYTSRPFGFDAALLGGILLSARRNNRRDGITGALICRADVYIQLLEGPAAMVEAAFARIERDDRHLDVERRVGGPVAARLFPAWDMLDDPARSWLWSAAEVAAGAMTAASAGVIVGIFDRLAAVRNATPVHGTTGISHDGAAGCPAGAIA